MEVKLGQALEVLLMGIVTTLLKFSQGNFSEFFRGVSALLRLLLDTFG